MDQYSFSEGINYIQGPNSSGKTEFFNFLDYMLGSNQDTIAEKPWFEDSLHAAKMQISFNGHIVSLYRELSGNEFSLILDGIDHKVSNINQYRAILNMLFLEGSEEPDCLSGYVGQELTYRTFTLFSYLSEETVGRMTGFFSKLSDTKYRVKQRLLFDFLFTVDPNSILDLQKRIQDLEAEARELEVQLSINEHYVEAVNIELSRLGIVERFDGSNSAEISELIMSAASCTEPPSVSGPMAEKAIEVEQLRVDIREQKHMIRDLNSTKYQDAKRLRLLNRLTSLIGNDNSRAALLGQTRKLLAEIETSIPRKDLSLRQDLLSRKEVLLGQLEAELNAVNYVFNPLDFDQKNKAILLANSYLSQYSTLCNPGDLKRVKEEVSKLRKEQFERRRTVDNASINNISATITTLYRSACDESSFVASDFAMSDFSIQFQKEGVGLQPVYNAGGYSVDLFTGSRARHTLMQLCGYLAFMRFLLLKRDIPVVPLLAFDNISSPFDGGSCRAIGDILSKFYTFVDRDDVQIFLFETESPDSLGIKPDTHIFLESEKRTGFNPFYNAG